MKRGFATLALVGVVAAVAVFALTQGPNISSGMNLKQTDTAYSKYLSKHGKSYGTKEEYILRRTLYEAAVADMNAHNTVEGQTWVKAINQFSDMTPEEREQVLGGGIQGEHRPHLKPLDHSDLVTAGTPVDWRSKMNPVKNQGQCGSCWSFAATATIEGRYAIKHGSKVTLAEQQMVDCATACNGCNGGWASRALQYVQSAGGQMSAASYPYRGVKGACRFSSGSVQAKVTGVSGVADAKSALASGPVAIYLEASNGF
jgi:C1A family cysteine protease